MLNIVLQGTQLARMVHKQHFVTSGKARVERMHCRRSHQCVQNHSRSQGVLQTGPKESLQLRVAPKLQHVLAQECIENLGPRILQAPEEEETTVPETILINLSRVNIIFPKANKRLDEYTA